MPIQDNDDKLNLLNDFVIALPSFEEDNVFAKSVTVICQHDQDGAMGIVVNRRSELTLGEVMSQLGIACEDTTLASQPVLHSGPVHSERGFVLHDGGMQWDSSLQISANLFLTTSREILEAIANGKGPPNALVALGCAAWGEGQIERELSENLWLTAPVAPNIVFDTPLDMRWNAAAGHIGVNFAHFSDFVGRA